MSFGGMHQVLQMDLPILKSWSCIIGVKMYVSYSHNATGTNQMQII